MKVKKLKQIPNFKTEDEERAFWDKADSTEYIDWSKAKHISFPNLRLTKWPKNKKQSVIASEAKQSI